MREIQPRDAKAALSAPVEAAARGGTAVITRRRKPRAVIPGIGEWDRPRDIPSFGRLLPTAPLEDADLPLRGAAPPAVHRPGTTPEAFVLLRIGLAGPAGVAGKRSITVRTLSMSAITSDFLTRWSGS